MRKREIPKRTLLLGQLVLGAVLAITASFALRRMNPMCNQRDTDPLYAPRPLISCAPQALQEIDLPVGRACVKVKAMSSTSCNLQLSPVISNTISAHMRSLSVHLIPRTGGLPIASADLDGLRVSKMLYYFAENLSPATDYIINLYVDVGTSKINRRTHLCSHMITTHPEELNLLQNPSFEESAPAPFLPSRPKTDNSEFNARHWTPFYNGGARRFCKEVSASQTRSVQPHSGQCLLVMARLQNDWHWPRSARYFGAHQAVPLADASAFVVSLWYIHLHGNTFNESASMVVSWVYIDGSVSDGTTVSLPLAEDWTPVCLLVRSTLSRVSMAHIFVHIEDDETLETDLSQSGKLFVDDIAVRIAHESESFVHCHSVQIATPNSRIREKPQRHLVSRKRPAAEELTAAVPLTADRVLRLETLSRHIGGGAIVATVAVRTAEEVEIFRKTWQAKRWLREHVDVMFVRRTDEGPLAINALRNMAVSMANTTFVVMLDVDMAPASQPYDCLRDGKALETLLPPGTRRLLAMGTFFTDVHQRAARNKTELLHMLSHDAGSAYCAGAQKAGRLKTWFWEQMGRPIRFQRDFEPYAIARRQGYPEYDERFRGYGFNKIAWTVAVEYAGWELFTLPQAFVTHLNHVENSWVSNIDHVHYIQTWRRFLAFVADVADARRDTSDLARVIGIEKSIGR